MWQYQVIITQVIQNMVKLIKHIKSKKNSKLFLVGNLVLTFLSPRFERCISLELKVFEISTEKP